MTYTLNVEDELIEMAASNAVERGAYISLKMEYMRRGWLPNSTEELRRIARTPNFAWADKMLFRVRDRYLRVDIAHDTDRLTSGRWDEERKAEAVRQ
ncbi:hypothetical protein P8935_14500 [Telmatobacter sp. DSM 110680]|uniref:Uncharacterized protein n=1 Tax=Telmatobacter sp. DSM 110680 TaxID=3036704 RepID=A0AAU7DDL5_9BACT